MPPRRWLRVRFALLAAASLAACAGQRPSYSGTVQTESVAVGSQVGGRVAEVDVAAGSPVRRGAVLLRIDPSMLRAQFDQARAEADQSAERLAELEHGNVPSDVARAQAQSAQAAAQYRQAVAQAAPEEAAEAASVREARASVRDARAAETLAQVTYARQSSLVATGNVSRQSLDQARADTARARAQLAQARARLARALQNYAATAQAQLPGETAAARANAASQAAAYETVRNGTRAEELAQARAQLAAARSAEGYARTRLDETVVRSPADGVVASFSLHPGDLLNPNQQAAIVDTFADPYVYIYASQKDLGALPDGRTLRVVSDAGGAAYDGTVEAHDRTAQFTPQATETADQRAELVYGVKVRIHDPHHALLDGTTVTIASP